MRRKRPREPVLKETPNGVGLFVLLICPVYLSCGLKRTMVATVIQLARSPARLRP
jgi:hypothetical protein